jgi:hypothetical protein
MYRSLRWLLVYLAALLFVLGTWSAALFAECGWNGCGQGCAIMSTCGVYFTGELWAYPTWSGCGGGLYWCGYGECVSLGESIFGLCNVECMETHSSYTWCKTWIVV